MNDKRLVRKMDNRMICGVCSGIADYLKVDVTVVRVVAAGLALFTSGLGAVFYLVAAFIMPADDKNN